LGVDPDDENSRVPMMVWSTCAFSIISIGKLTPHSPVCLPPFANLSINYVKMKAIVKAQLFFKPKKLQQVDFEKELLQELIEPCTVQFSAIILMNKRKVL